MHPIDRFTKDEASAKVWWIFALILIVGFVLTFPGHDRAVQRTRDEAAADATQLTRDVVDPIVAGGEQVDETLLDDIVDESAAITAVRVWASDGSLLVSTDSDDQISSQEALNDEFIRAALAGPAAPVAQDHRAR